MQKKRKKIIIIISSVVAFVAVVLCVTLPCLYVNGFLSTEHPLNKPKDGQIRVACVGDSLTYGMGISDWKKNNYPAQLGRLMGDKYCVNNYGFSARTAQSSGDHPYTKEKLYRQSLDFNPRIVVIMLGSNDTKAKNWKGKEAYKNDYRQIIKSYLDLESVQELWIMAPTPVFGEPYGISDERIKNDLRETAIELSVELNTGYIDLYELFEGKPHLFSDGAHPKAEGASIIANAVYERIEFNRVLYPPV